MKWPEKIRSRACAGLVLVLVVPAGVVPPPRVRDLLGGQAEEEHVLLAGLLGDLDRGAVAGADGQGAVHHELHVARAAGLVAGGRDLLGDVAGRDQPLGQGDGVVRQEDDPELAADVGVVVDHGADVVDQPDDELGEAVRRGGLAGEHGYPSISYLQRRHGMFYPKNILDKIRYFQSAMRVCWLQL